MKKFWCLLLIACLLVGCTPTSDAPVVQVPSAAPTETPQSEPTPTVSAVPTATEAPTETPAPTPVPTLSPDEKLMRYVESLSIEEKIGQLCMFGFTGTQTVSSEFRSILKTYWVGNAVLYGQNIARTNGDGGFAQCRKLTDSVREAGITSIPMLIGIDVEGGRVTRFRWKPALYGARSLGSKGSEDFAEKQFLRVAEGLLSAGINTDFAPCLDVAKNPDETFLKKRIISSDADVAARIGAACVQGLHDGGCLSFVKHYPGHGATTSDSHDLTPVVDKSLDALSRYELVPFLASLDAADGVMVAHILYPAVDRTQIATLSHVFITELLRETYGFDGIVISDDFRMAGLRKQCSLGEAAVRFILAGGDIILCGANHPYQIQILNGLYAAVGDGTLSEARINESVVRILRAKMRVSDWTPEG